VTSRTALLAGILPLMLFFSIGLKSKIIFKKLYIFFLGGISFIIYLVSILPKDTFNVAFEMFVNLSENKGISTASSTATIDSYALPSHLSTYFFGNGNFMRNDLNLNIDDGFEIMLYGCGIFYLLISLLIYVYYVYISLKGTDIKFQKKSIILIFTLVLLLNFKADSLFSRVFSDVFAFLVAIGLSNNRNIVYKEI
jgi:hypothetical protein